jgi:imidazolonepropionase-like amidohydrolase
VTMSQSQLPTMNPSESMTRRQSPHHVRPCTARVVALALAASVGTMLAPEAADAQVRMTVAPQELPVVLRGATIHTVTNGVIENGMIVMDRGKITAIGANVEIPRGAKVVDVSGKHIYPGLIDAYSTVGITEIGSVDVSNDINEIGDFNPNVRAEVAVNAESRHIGTTRSAGVLVAFSTPGGGVISGLSSAMSLEGWTWEEMSMKGAAAMNVNWPDPVARPRRGGGGPPGGRGGAQAAPKTYAEQVQSLKDFFAEARAYRDAAAAGQTQSTDSRYAAMIPALNGEIPVVVAANGAAQINDAITWGKEEKVRLVIRGGADAIHVADRLKAENVPVILTSTMAAPNRDHEGYDGAYGSAALLHKAGVKIAIAGGTGGLYSYRLPWEAGVAVAFGLPEEEALKAVTINAAQFMGIDDKVGSLEVGKEATLLITTGTPLDMTSNIEQSYIQGREIDMNDIQKHFFKKYMEKIKQQAKKIAS